jgi:hypothetical protein
VGAIDANGRIDIDRGGTIHQTKLGHHITITMCED